MTRGVSGDRIEVKPTNNIYTALVVVGVLVNFITFILMFVRWTAIFGPTQNLFKP